MAIINQPFQGQLGDILIHELGNYYSSFYIFSAFAKNSGVLRLRDSLLKHRENGGSITAFIGVDLDGTSYEALLNLYSLCDNLFVVHSENPSTTFHSKMYLLEKADEAWCAIGSNNLTGGGLWTNIESCNIDHFALPKEQSQLENIHRIAKKYMENDYACSIKISTFDDINKLLEAHYITKEVSQRIERIKQHSVQRSKHSIIPLFGTEKVSIPLVVTSGLTIPKQEILKPANKVVTGEVVKQVFNNEQFWFEMRESTGGSRNILDLSKTGKIVAGSVRGTDYEYPHDSSKMYGGVKFFDIDPEDVARNKNITINYLGKDYYPSTIKFAPDNGSWRIQLKGTPSDGSDELSKYGKRDFVHKILVFEKISTDYYVLSLLEESELEKVKSLSRVWARNGISSSSKAYGML